MRYLILLVFWVRFLGATEAWVNDVRFDVSYLWHTKLEAALAYREKVARLLGPAAARNLKVVKGDPLYGVIYQGKADGATAVVALVTRLGRAARALCCAACRAARARGGERPWRGLDLPLQGQ